MPGTKLWLALESNPEVITTFSHKIGCPPTWQFHDVFGTDPELLAMVPTPVVAVLFLFPLTPEIEQFATDSVEKIKKEGQSVPESLWFCKQKIGNACGTMAVLHALLNCQESMEIEGWAKRLYEKTKTKSPDDRADELNEDTELESLHQSAAEEGQTQVQPQMDDVDSHFLCIVHKDGSMYELDGRKPFPINLGKSSPSSLLQDAVGSIKERIFDREPGQVNFSIMALGPALPLD
ncbi:hypothetical protein GUITHDRAFT_160344 [Guillardia theta CCMP2712]|uniref:Ubiquitin carboxyl-terminal hydrolase n=1 Tax=Guillardia theta (strain CCMP2712) TaxID=905079 RepID=L1I6B8_GUITC|nr:hypothetical protein GUITHDRAFT_160344 [Guillardia theta CCMP2712]EKX31771.1 hypothetical protein GUITHDRAFT_160344 [Guillardia theta CCMP2712]|eukprot:XP_005818751.1 hypothetical protein GUITHDRAFT_160344 [Guillardia theta CCMP2712]